MPPIQQAAPLLQDLNEEPNLEDPTKVIIHPPQALVQVLPQYQDLDWELMNQEVEMEIAQLEPPEQLIPKPVEQLPAPVLAAPLQHLNFLHHEIPEDMLMNDAELAEQDLLLQQKDHLGEHNQNNIQVGMVKIVESPPPFIAPKVFGNMPILFPWEKEAPKVKGSLSVDIPVEWAAFFASLMQSPSHYSWVKEFVMSGFSGLLNSSGQSVSVPVPSICPTSPVSSCSKLTDWSTPLSGRRGGH